ncbi:MAG: hypothetical protein LBN08_04365 [Lactobacillales bacterium]|jgi:hypothetical protein|nr:hypothetical protein [Lactobacillales bacterium]
MKNLKITLAIIFATITMGACLSTNAAVVAKAAESTPVHQKTVANYERGDLLKFSVPSALKPLGYQVIDDYDYCGCVNRTTLIAKLKEVQKTNSTLGTACKLAMTALGFAFPELSLAWTAISYIVSGVVYAANLSVQVLIDKLSAANTTYVALYDNSKQILYKPTNAK